MDTTNPFFLKVGVQKQESMEMKTKTNGWESIEELQRTKSKWCSTQIWVWSLIKIYQWLLAWLKPKQPMQPVLVCKEWNNLRKIEPHAIENLLVEKPEVFQEFLLKQLNAVHGSHMDACIIKELSQQRRMFLKNTAAMNLLKKILKREVTPLRKLAASMSAKTPMETATSEITHKVQDTRSWPNMLLAKSIGLTTSHLHGNLLQPMVTQVWDISIKPKKTQNQFSMNVLLSPNQEIAIEKAKEDACGN